MNPWEPDKAQQSVVHLVKMSHIEACYRCENVHQPTKGIIYLNRREKFSSWSKYAKA